MDMSKEIDNERGQHQVWVNPEEIINKENEIEDIKRTKVKSGSITNVDHSGRFTVMAMQEVDSKVVWRRFSMEVLSGLYTITIVALAAVLPLTIFLSGGNFRTKGVHVTVFHLYLYIVGSIFCVYLTILVRRYNKAPNPNDLTLSNSSSGIKTDVSKQGTYVINDSISAVKHDDIKVINEPRRRCHDEHVVVPAVYEVDDGVNFFLRLGVIAFGMGGILLEGIRIVENSRVYVLWECYGSVYVVSEGARLIFILVQTYVLFKYHAVGVNVHKPLVKLGLKHTVATNLAIWMNVIVKESVEAYNHNVLEGNSGNVSTASITSNRSGTEEVEDDDLVANLCVSYPDSLSYLASPFLFPFIIEYSLLAAAIFYKMHSFVGPERYHWTMKRAHHVESDKKCNPHLYDDQDNASQCAKANTGLFFGLAILVVTVIGVSFYLYFSTQYDEENIETTLATIYISSDLTLKFMAFVTIIFAYWQIMRLYFHGMTDSALDQNLLIFALFGSYLLGGFVGVASGSQMNSDNPDISRPSKLIITSVVLDFIQISLLAAFILDGLHRKSVTTEHITKKPGRSLITFLLILNLSMWLIGSFEMKLIHQIAVFYDFYGHLAWTIIVSIAAPVAVYFRFHCAVCLSVIWAEAYAKVPLEEISEIHLEKCGKIL